MTICGYGITIVAVNFFNDPPVVQIFVHELIFKHDFFSEWNVPGIFFLLNYDRIEFCQHEKK